MTADEMLWFTYVGGPTVLIDFGGVRILTDPTFDPAGSEYPNGPVTPAKTMGPALDAASLGRIDAILLSPDHHLDNLDAGGRRLLPTAHHVLTTAEGASRLNDNAVGLTAWQTHTVSSPEGRTLQVTATPARQGPEG